MKRTPETIANSSRALDIGKTMLNFIQPNSRAFQAAVEGLEVLHKWIEGNATVADCRASAFDIHEIARECLDSRERNALRSIGHAVATAHVSSHLQACKEYSDKVIS